jgi:hypothetical protein
MKAVPLSSQDTVEFTSSFPFSQHSPPSRIINNPPTTFLMMHPPLMLICYQTCCKRR